MKRIAICMAMVMVLASVVAVIGSDEFSAEPETQTFKGTMADVYVMERPEGVTSIGSISNGDGIYRMFKSGGAGDDDMKNALDNGNDISGIPGDYSIGSGVSARIYVFVTYEYGGSYKTSMNVNGSTVVLSDMTPDYPIPKIYFASGQPVKLSIHSEMGGDTTYWGIFGHGSYLSYMNIPNAESEITTPMSGDYSLYRQWGSNLYLHYTVEYEPLPEENVIMGYVALVIGIAMIALLFAFSLRQRIKSSDLVGRDSVEMDESDMPAESKKGRFKRRKD